jgi:5-methylcytosine-specific restriction protein B
MPIQKVFFGSPGTGKSHLIDNDVIPNSLSIANKSNIIKTVFHPEYTYGEFMGKLLPISKKVKKEKKVEYNYYAGHFMKALARAYRNIIDTYIDEEGNIQETEHKAADNVVLVIDEINRGNSASIFGTVFQLLDREKSGWSSYGITISDLEYEQLIHEIGFENKSNYNDSDEQLENNFKYNQHTGLTAKKRDILFEKLYSTLNLSRGYTTENGGLVNLKERVIHLPFNLSILASMNTSDNSVYFMDNAFKRRWDWEFVNTEDGGSHPAIAERTIVLYDKDKYGWKHFVNKLNAFICSNYKIVRKIEDKQIGYFFINEEVINEEHIKNKLMFFLWDSVFGNNKKPLVDLIGAEESEIVTFGQFTKKENVLKFVKNIHTRT